MSISKSYLPRVRCYDCDHVWVADGGFGLMSGDIVTCPECQTDNKICLTQEIDDDDGCLVALQIHTSKAFGKFSPRSLRCFYPIC
jgi:hypothetical protein